MLPLRAQLSSGDIKKIQTTVGRTVLESFPECRAQWTQARLQAMRATTVPIAEIELGLRILADMPFDLVSRVIKTWCNAWFTSRRLHENPRLPCLFGCSGSPSSSSASSDSSSGDSSFDLELHVPKIEDSLPHYLTCPHLGGAFSVGWAIGPLNPLMRLGFSPISRESLVRTAALHEIYHALRARRRAAAIVEDISGNRADCARHAQRIRARGR